MVKLNNNSFVFAKIVEVNIYYPSVFQGHGEIIHFVASMRNIGLQYGLSFIDFYTNWV